MNTYDDWVPRGD